MASDSVTYRPGAAVIPQRADGAVLVGRRTVHARSYVGYLAFPGGGQDRPDEALPRLSTSEEGGAAARGCAMRELGEETGRWLVVDEGGAPPSEAVAQRFLQGVANDAPLGPLLHELGLVFDDRRLIALSTWYTADHRTRQFAVQQFLLPLDDDDALLSEPHDELEDLAWRSVHDIERGWAAGDVFLLPPIRHVVAALSAHADRDVDGLVEALKQVPSPSDAYPRDIVAGVAIQPYQTPTLPPAENTNTVLLGAGDFLIVDPATPFPEEQERFDALIAHLEASGRRPTAVVLTHHHIDHASDAARVKARYQLPVWAHEKTAALVDVEVDRLLTHGEVLRCPGPVAQGWEVLFTPGHAPGHICLFERDTGVLIAGDMVAAVGSILIEPSEGHMGTYLESLRALAALPVRSVVPSHGPLLADGTAKLEEQIVHRRARQAQVLTALQGHVDGATPQELVPGIYGGQVPEAAFGLAALSVESALVLLVEEGQAETEGGRFRALS